MARAVGRPPAGDRAGDTSGDIRCAGGARGHGGRAPGRPTPSPARTGVLFPRLCSVPWLGNGLPEKPCALMAHLKHRSICALTIKIIIANIPKLRFASSQLPKGGCSRTQTTSRARRGKCAQSESLAAAAVVGWMRCCRGTLRVGPALAALLVMPTLVNGVGAAPSLHASTKPHSNPNPFSRNATSLHFGAGSSRAHVIWGGVFEAQPAGGGHMAGNSGVPAPWQPGTASKCQAAPAGSQHRGTPPRTALPLLIPGHWAQGHGGGLVPPLCRVPSEMGWAGGTWLGCLGFGVAIVLCYACSVAVLAADANLVPSPKCPMGALG